MAERYIGLISGTSLDGVDAVIAEFSQSECAVIAADTLPYPPALHDRATRLIEQSNTSLTELGHLDSALGGFFAECANKLLGKAGLCARDITAIGHHGQTVHHAPEPPDAFTLQIGDPNTVAARTGITTAADFRRLDMALGGQGAPLVCAFHAWRFTADTEVRAIVNVGGIANITLLAPGADPRGFDSGPGNTLLDAWVNRHRGQAYDSSGKWGATGLVNNALLKLLLAEPYFGAQPPKSTGRELFNQAWLDRYLALLDQPVCPQDVQATLAELTAQTIVNAVRAANADCSRIILCGGGSHNSDLRARIAAASHLPVEDTGSYGISPDWVEGAAFAWLAYARLHGLPGNVPAVTGATRPAILGSLYCGTAS